MLRIIMNDTAILNAMLNYNHAVYIYIAIEQVIQGNNVYNKIM